MELNWFYVIQKTFMVSGFVLFMMLIIEYINVQTRGKWSNPFKQSKWLQLVVAVFLGITPGCAGTFTVVTLFTHDIMNFSALLGGTIATFGDEAFVMISMIPFTTVKLSIVITIVALAVGLIFNLFSKNNPHKYNLKHFETHNDECCTTQTTIITITHQLQKFTFARAMLISVLVLIVFSQFASFGKTPYGGNKESLLSPESLIFITLGAVSMFIILTVPKHFLMKHLWEHVLKKHFFRLFLWTLGALVTIAILTQYFSFNEWAKLNNFYILFLALLIGIIPISGPHILFITMFMNGIIPFSFLLANSIVQEGHAGIPLLAEDKMSFIKIKAIKIVIGFITGLAGIYFSF